MPTTFLTSSSAMVGRLLPAVSWFISSGATSLTSWTLAFWPNISRRASLSRVRAEAAKGLSYHTSPPTIRPVPPATGPPTNTTPTLLPPPFTPS